MKELAVTGFSGNFEATRRQLLVNAVIVQVPISEIHISGNATYQDLGLL
jgi:hypothetical protein